MSATALLLLAAAAPQTADARLAALVEEQSRLIAEQRAALEALTRRLAAVEQAQGRPSATPPPQLAATTPPTGREERASREAPAGASALRPSTDLLNSPLPQAVATRGDEVFDWSRGSPRVTSADGRYAFRVRGRLQLDAASTMGSRFADRDITGTDARGVRLGVDGRVGDHIGYRVEADFAGNQTTVRGAFVSFSSGRNRPSGWEVSVGNRVTDRSIEGASGSDSVPFAERNLVALGLQPRKGFFGLGTTAALFGRRWHANVQVAGRDLNDGGTLSDDVTYTGRVHWNPVKTEQAVLHLGGWAFLERFARGADPVPLSQRVAARFNRLVTVGAPALEDPDRGTAWGIEGGGTWRSLWLFGETGRRSVRAHQDLRSVDVSASSIGAGWYVTGEKPPYVARTGNWSKPVVLDPVVDGGWGAIELAARYDRIRYSGIDGGSGRSATLGINWYLLDWLRLTANWIRWRTDDRGGDFPGPDDGDSVVGRVQISF